jgi:malonate decarboxylase beta subunit
MSARIRPAFTQLRPRQRVQALLDRGTFREILGPFDLVESPHLPRQGTVPQSDDGAVIGRGSIAGVSAVVLALDGAFQGGGVGEVSGAKLAATLEQALDDHRNGIPTRVVLVLDSGGIRLQEANLGLLAVAEIHAALVELTTYGPVVGIIAGPIGCFGGMAIAAGLTSHLIMTRHGRLGLNGPEVIETEAGVDELDASDRTAVWAAIGGAQRVATGQAEILVDDAIESVVAAARQVWRTPADPRPLRAERIDQEQRTLAAFDLDRRPTPAGFAAIVTRELP